MPLTPDLAFNYLEKARSADRLGHAYLIAGATGAGKRALALRAVNFLSGENHADIDGALGDDVLLVRPTKKSRRISIDAIRDGIEKRMYVSRTGDHVRIGVIEGADRMGPEAENALLKTLEEPPANSLLLLLSAEPERLLDTTRSRCIRIDLLPPAVRPTADDPAFRELRARIASSLLAENPDPGTSLGLSRQLLGVLAEVKADLAKKHKEEFRKERDRIAGASEGKWLEKREEEYDAMTAAAYLGRRDEACADLHAWLGDCLRASHGSQTREFPEESDLSESVGAKLDPADLLLRIEHLGKMIDGLRTNAQEGLVLEVGFLRAFGSTAAS